MRAATLVLAILAFATTQDQEPPQEDHSRCASRCAAVEKDTHTHKACKCAAGKGQGCDANGARIVEEMEGCINQRHCLRGCCHCCPKD